MPNIHNKVFPIIFIFLSSVLIFSSSGRAMVCESPKNEDLLIKYLQNLLKESEFEKAMKCTESILKSWPKHQDFIFLKVRILAFQKKYKESISYLNKSSKKNYLYYEIKGDVAWYEGKSKLALKYYRISVKREQRKQEKKITPSHLWIKYLKTVAIEEKSKLKRTIKKALKQHPKNKEILKLKKTLEKEKSWLTLSSSYQKSKHTNYEQEDYNLSLQKIGKKKAFGAQLLRVRRSYAGESFVDSIATVQGSKELGLLREMMWGELQLSFAPEPSFSPSYAALFKLSGEYTKDHSGEFWVHFKKYQELVNALGMNHKIGFLDSMLQMKFDARVTVDKNILPMFGWATVFNHNSFSGSFHLIRGLVNSGKKQSDDTYSTLNNNAQLIELTYHWEYLKFDLWMMKESNKEAVNTILGGNIQWKL